MGLGKGERPYRVALAGYYGFGNLGDELLALAALSALERVGVPRDRVVVLSADPEGSERVLGARAMSRWSLRSLTLALRSSDTLLLGGGGLFQDRTSLRSCLWYWGLVRLARLCGAAPWALGQSIGPLRALPARWLTWDALRLCRVVHLRDAPSMDWAGRLGLSAVKGRDLALTLRVPVPPPEKDVRERGGRLLLNLRPSPDVARWVGLVAPYAASFPGEVVGVALSGEDEVLLRALQKDGRLGLSRIERVIGLEETARLWTGATVAVGMRLHFAVLASLWRTPLVVLPYDPKVAAFAEEAGVPCAGDVLPEPRQPSVPGLDDVAAEIDGLCRDVLSSEPRSGKRP